MLDAGRELVEPCKAKAHGRQGLVPRRVRALCQEAALNVEHFVPMLARVGGHSSHSFVPPALGHQRRRHRQYTPRVSDPRDLLVSSVASTRPRLAPAPAPTSKAAVSYLHLKGCKGNACVEVGDAREAGLMDRSAYARTMQQTSSRTPQVLQVCCQEWSNYGLMPDIRPKIIA